MGALMSNYQQPGAEHGGYDPTTVNMACPLCAAGNIANARMVRAGSFEWRCSNGHRFTQASYQPPGQFLPVFDEPNAEVRIFLTDLQTLRG
jgi:hypothetical protein